MQDMDISVIDFVGLSHVDILQYTILSFHYSAELQLNMCI